jgi:hypothetical protein
LFPLEAVCVSTSAPTTTATRPRGRRVECWIENMNVEPQSENPGKL